MKINNQNEFIKIIAKRAHFTRKDVKDILDEMIRLFEETVEDYEFDFSKEKNVTLLRIRGFGKLCATLIPERKGNKGETLPPTTKVYFTLAENIRQANKKEIVIWENENEQ